MIDVVLLQPNHIGLPHILEWQQICTLTRPTRTLRSGHLVCRLETNLEIEQGLLH